MTAHSVLPPSGAANWIACSGWVLYNQLFPGSDTDASIEGTEAHDEAARCLKSCQQQDGEIYIPSDWNVRMYTTNVLKSLESFGGLQALRVEQRVAIPGIHAECFGTPDGAAYDTPRRTLHVYEYKHGFKPVEVFENPQLCAYTLGLIEELNLIDAETTVHFHLIQPRAQHIAGAIREWRTNAAALRPIWNALHYAAGKIMLGENTTVPGPQCDYCPGRVMCPSNQAYAARAADYGTAFTMLDLSPQQAGAELSNLRQALKVIEARADALEAQVDGAVRAGVAVPGWGLQDAPGRAKWTIPPTEIYALGDMCGINLRVTDPCTPTQAKSAGIDEAVINAYSKRETSRKLVQFDPTQLRHVFGASHNE